MNNKCKKLHNIIRYGKRFDFKSNFSLSKHNFPDNGVYLMMESGERGHNGLRIVRVGINKTGTLFNRLKKHVSGNMNNSIFRRHLGRIIGEDESIITDYIKNNISFYVVDDKDNKREVLERKTIGTIANCKDCKYSDNWRGKDSETPAIKDSGLWNVYFVRREYRLNDKDLGYIKNNLVKK